MNAPGSSNLQSSICNIQVTMPTVYEGNFATPPGRFATDRGSVNHFIVEHLVNGALERSKRHGRRRRAIDLVWVPGSFEIPRSPRPGRQRAVCGLICLGRHHSARHGSL